VVGIIANSLLKSVLAVALGTGAFSSRVAGGLLLIAGVGAATIVLRG